MPNPEKADCYGSGNGDDGTEDDEQGKGHEREGNELGAPEVLGRCIR